MINDIRTWSALNQFLIASRASIVFLVLCGLLYTGIATLLGSVLFPWQATASLIEKDGVVVGSRLVGQAFSSPQYFHGRPSAADYDPFNTAGSNLAPSNPELRRRAHAESTRIQLLEGVSANAIPIDLIAASGSGLDPHISLQSARLQVPRIAGIRELSADTVLKMVNHHTEEPSWGVLGRTRVNVLMLNLALDAMR